MNFKPADLLNCERRPRESVAPEVKEGTEGFVKTIGPWSGPTINDLNLLHSFRHAT